MCKKREDVENLCNVSDDLITEFIGSGSGEIGGQKVVGGITQEGFPGQEPRVSRVEGDTEPSAQVTEKDLNPSTAVGQFPELLGPTHKQQEALLWAKSNLKEIPH